MTPELRVTISKTRDGLGEYLQVMSADQTSVNVVLIAGKIVVEDARPKAKRKGPDHGA